MAVDMSVNILIVDDYKTMVMIIRNLLKQLGFNRVDEALDGETALAKLRVVRSWGAVRVLSKDGFPVYQQSAETPGAFAINCHSGVTLAAAHAGPLADILADPDLAVRRMRLLLMLHGVDGG